jgi:hypothetical protein
MTDHVRLWRRTSVLRSTARRTLIGLSVSLAMAALTVGPAMGRAQQLAAGFVHASPRATISLEGLRTAAAGETSTAVTWSTTLAAGESSVVEFAVADDCSASVGARSVDDARRLHGVARRFRVTLVEAARDRIRFTVQEDGGQIPASTTLTLREGLPHLFTFQPCSAEHFTGIGWRWVARMADATTGQAPRLDYEVWMEVKDSAGAVYTDRALATAAAGDVVALGFPPVNQPLGACTLRTSVSLRLKADVQRDGTLAVLLKPRRGIEQLRADRGLSIGGAQEGGAADLTLRSGEPVRVALPPPSPDGLFMLTLPCDDGARASVPADVASAVRAQEVSLVLRVTTHGQ